MDVQLEDVESGLAGHESTGEFCMINPEIIELSDEQIILKEGCLSIPEQNYEIRRPKYLTVKYKDLNNEGQMLKAGGWLARCIQHEIDHLNGILYIRHLSKLKYDIAMKKAQRVRGAMSNEDLELLRFYYEEGIDCTLTESEEEKEVKEEKETYLLRQPSQKRLAWEDLKKIREYLDANISKMIVSGK
ncbi:unnamed protein product [Ceratitis capitata]|uniref:Peptide deformylase n=1 Tax=Ceratitis capitata TaxID=7213 RepID=A0A811UCC6_CERCA|nr:unnamed protein product [Ceratitis capitata]